MTAPPRTAELILSSLGAEPHFRDAVIGDLAQEFAERADEDGASRARRWYYREAIRATPHLLRNWSRGVRRQDLARLAGIVITSYTILLITVVMVFAMATAVASGLGISLRLSPPIGAGVSLSALMTIGMLLLSAAIWTFAGYVAAWLDSGTPLIAAMTMAGVHLCFAIVSAAVVHPSASSLQVTMWARFGAFIVLVVAPVAGATVRIRSTHRPELIE